MLYAEYSLVSMKIDMNFSWEQVVKQSVNSKQNDTPADVIFLLLIIKIMEKNVVFYTILFYLSQLIYATANLIDQGLASSASANAVSLYNHNFILFFIYLSYNWLHRLLGLAVAHLYSRSIWLK